MSLTSHSCHGLTQQGEGDTLWDPVPSAQNFQPELLSDSLRNPSQTGDICSGPQPTGRMESGLGRGTQRKVRQGVEQVQGKLVLSDLAEDRFRGCSHHLLVLDQTSLDLGAEVRRDRA